MRTRSPLVLDVVELLEQPGSRRPIRIETPLELEVGLVRLAGPLHLDFVLQATDGVLVQGTISGSYTGACRRCLRPLTHGFSFDAADLYRLPGDVWEEGYVVTEGTIDLERMTRDNVALNIPSDPLCREDCAGLCARCGADLNEGRCACPQEVDPRWSALRELGTSGTE
jgi:uncharacterized protein